MWKMTVQELREYILDTGLSCDCKMVEKWLQDGALKCIKDGDNYLVAEQDIDSFIYDLLWEGTIYERGIDDTEKIERLLLEVKELKEEISKLKTENSSLEQRLGIGPF
ncbi:hypothetical protein [Sporosarcina sp. BP05]|uniref:hypothetical protein n=1 Tax=Sporosarcina sp. BP05 TaxID=2758726 RepID=UPI001644F35A|nr:hypothetical protein [Sporosarcina sp. BP05]